MYLSLLGSLNMWILLFMAFWWSGYSLLNWNLLTVVTSFHLLIKAEHRNSERKRRPIRIQSNKPGNLRFNHILSVNRNKPTDYWNAFSNPLAAITGKILVNAVSLSSVCTQNTAQQAMTLSHSHAANATYDYDRFVETLLVCFFLNQQRKALLYISLISYCCFVVHIALFNPSE